MIAGLALLIKGADWLMDGATSVAARLGISPLIVGLTIVAFGTSMPEFLVSVVAATENNADLAIANIVGSNIANVLLVLGIAAMIRPLPVRDSTVVSEIPFSLTAALLVGFLANAALFSSSAELTISRFDGVVLLLFFFLFMLYVYKETVEGREELQPESPEALSTTRTSIYLVIGIVCLYLGGNLTVDGAVSVASRFNVSDAVIGLTIIAIGTSLPELVASCMAAYRGQTDIAVGNVVGSNIFNLLWVLGATASMVELPFEVITNSDLLAVIGSSSLILVAVVISRRNAVLRWHGGVFCALYVAYLFYVVLRT